MSNEIQDDEIYRWIDVCLTRENITNYQVETTESSAKGEGYASKVIFVKINGTNISNGENTKLDLVFKVSRIFKNSLQKEMQELYKKEIVVYEKIFPELKRFTEGNKISEIFQSVPRCFKTFSVNDREIVVLENLRSIGYEAHDRLAPMNFYHLKLILKNYAKFHAISFAFRDQRRSEFETLVSNYSNIYRAFIESDFKFLVQKNVVTAQDMIRNIDESLATKMDVILERGTLEILDELFNENVKEYVITHGDCWNCNFLFKYENGNKSSPSKAIILDWQVSSLHSPTIDLSYFLFAVSSTEQTAKFDELLKYYYEQLSKSIRELGSDPEKLFSYNKFQEHWKRFAITGLLLSVSFLRAVLCKKSDVIEIDAFENTQELMDSMTDINKENSDLYIERILATMKYYFELQGI